MTAGNLTSHRGAGASDLRHVLTLMREGYWRGAHDQVQLDTTELGAWLHGLLHVQEGDLEDAEYWFGRAGRNFRSRGTLAEELEQFDKALRDDQGPGSI